MKKKKLSPEDKLMKAIFGKPLSQMTEEDKCKAYEKFGKSSEGKEDKK